MTIPDFPKPQVGIAGQRSAGPPGFLMLDAEIPMKEEIRFSSVAPTGNMRRLQ
jgi:hypothetical protein